MSPNCRSFEISIQITFKISIQKFVGAINLPIPDTHFAFQIKFNPRSILSLFKFKVSIDQILSVKYMDGSVRSEIFEKIYIK